MTIHIENTWYSRTLYSGHFMKKTFLFLAGLMIAGGLFAEPALDQPVVSSETAVTPAPAVAPSTVTAPAPAVVPSTVTAPDPDDKPAAPPTVLLSTTAMSAFDTVKSSGDAVLEKVTIDDAGNRLLVLIQTSNAVMECFIA
jgi:hypothetical protein